MREWEGFNTERFKTVATDPIRFWLIKVPPKSPQQRPAVRIGNRDVVSSDVERSHDITKANCTRITNIPNYELNQAHTFA